MNGHSNILKNNFHCTYADCDEFSTQYAETHTEEYNTTIFLLHRIMETN